MRRRSYRPEVPGPLEERSSPSGFAGPSAEPVVFPIRRLDQVVLHVQLRFSTFTRVHMTSLLRDQLRGDVIPIPFAQEDGLPAAIDDTVDQLERNLATNVPRAVRTAQREVVAAIHADVQARVQAGDVVLR